MLMRGGELGPALRPGGWHLSTHGGSLVKPWCNSLLIRHSDDVEPCDAELMRNLLLFASARMISATQRGRGWTRGFTGGESYVDQSSSYLVIFSPKLKYR